MRFITKNLDGLTTRTDAVLRAVAAAHRKDPICALAIQEHHLTAQDTARLNVRAKAKRLDLLYLQADKPVDASAKGGAALIIPYSSIELDKDETIDAAVDRIKASADSSADGRFISVRCKIRGVEHMLVSIYAPVDDDVRADFFRDVTPKITSPAIIGMDANCVLNPAADLERSAINNYPNGGASELATLISSADVTDITRETLGNSAPYFTNHTVISRSRNGEPDKLTHTRIDLILTPHVDAMIWEHKVGVDFLRFDRTYGHDMVQAALTVATGERGRDIQRINENIYLDPIFNGTLLTEMQRIASESTANKRDTWEAIKTEVARLSLGETKRQKFKKSNDLKQQQAILEAVEQQIRAGTASASDFSYRDELRSLIRSTTKAEFTLHSTLERDAHELSSRHDVNTAAFHRQWSPRSPAQWVEAVTVADWTDPSSPVYPPDKREVTESKEIANAFTDYYEPLFADKPISDAAKELCLRKLRSGNRVLAPTAARCGSEITKETIEHTCAYLPTGKSPGPDLIPNQFYRVFSSFVSPILAGVFNESHEEGSLPTSMLEGTISVLYKKKARNDPRNYRPITLLNNDYKIMMRILSQRMNEAVVQFVSKDQNGFVPDGFIAENLMRLQLVMDYIDDENMEALYMFADMEKAFDRCSWSFLVDSLDALGFDNSFIDFVKLAYSHDNPPKRRMYVNGFLGRLFSLGSGVAQGCPISPLLFLCIGEPLTRLINDHPHIKGIRMGGVDHKISQFADDSTFLMLLTDVPHVLHILRVWQNATSMKENATKRELLLLGKLRGHPERLPADLVAGGVTPAADGETIRALGVPVGNDFDPEAWWLGRYTTVKTRIGAWNGLARLSLAGRNILLQSILYGSLRYWFFTLLVPNSIVSKVESDAKQLLWSMSPDLRTDEAGTSKRSKRFIAELPSYLPKKQGGGGIMHLESHIKAFQAQWIIKYLDPRDSPWKNALDHWLSDDKLGRGILLARGQSRPESLLPDGRCAYIRSCLEAFRSLNLRHDDTLCTHESIGEPLWLNPRFRIDLNPNNAEEWEDQIDTYRLSDLTNDSGELTTRNQWLAWFWEYAPQGLGKQSTNEWVHQRTLDWPIIRMAIPTAVKAALRSTPPLQHGDIVMVEESDGSQTYAVYNVVDDEKQLEELFLDASQYPHRTGRVTTVDDSLKLTHVALWQGLNKHYQKPYAGDEENEEEDESRASIIGPTVSAFPLNDGWYPSDRSARKEDDKPRRLSDLTIHELTAIFTDRIVGNARPNCEANWKPRWPRSTNWRWNEIWASVGTPLTDPTEENAWWKLLHRAWNARNRHPALVDQNCRLGCACKESMLHMVTCPCAAPLWTACVQICHRLLGERDRLGSIDAVIFNVDNISGRVLNEFSRALLRHTLQQYYCDVTRVETDDARFVWQGTLHRALLRLRTALLRKIYSIQKLHTTRVYTHLTEVVPDEERKRYAKLATINHDGTYAISDAFQREIDTADAAAKARHDTIRQQQQARARGHAPQQPRR